MTTITRDILSELKHSIKGLYGDRLKNTILFGSRARPDHHPESDLDLLVVLDLVSNWEAESERLDDIVSELSLDRDVVIACFVMGEKEFQNDQSPFLMNVRREGVTV